MASLSIKNQNIEIKDLVKVARDENKLKISSAAKKRIDASRKAVKDSVDKGEVVYGITTGFGAFKDTSINKKQTEKLQENLILSHSVGVGDYLPTEVVRGVMLLMVNYLSKGHSGVKYKTVNTLVKMLNKGVHPLVPEKGSVGSSGDLAPSAHIALVLIGKGEAEFGGKKMKGSTAMKKAGIKPVKLGAKEGLAITNNTSTMTSIAALLLHDSKWLLKVADIATSLSLQALRGTDKGYDKRIHDKKPHKGQIETAQNLRKLLKGSGFVDHERVQESYSFRCVPQVHGAIREALSYSERVTTTEMNSVTDNPLIFSDKDNIDVVSGGNFHGEPVAIAMDTAGIAISEISNISDRRVAALVDPANNNGLPAFLIEKGGLNSGFMILQYTTAALVSENKVLAHPASVDSIPTSANVEDLVSMGTISARNASEILENTALVLTIELMTACQAIDLRNKLEEKGPFKLSSKTKKAYDLIREIVPYFEKDEVYYPYIDKLRQSLEDLSALL